MWEFPRAEVAAGDAHEGVAIRLLAGVGVAADVGAEIATIRHAVTRFRIALTGLEATYRGGEFRAGDYVEGRWLTADELAAYPVSVPQRRLVRAAAEPTLRLF